MLPFGRHYAIEAAEEMAEGECMPCNMTGQPANRPIPPGQSVREQALGLAVQVRQYEQVPEKVNETISTNMRSGGV